MLMERQDLLLNRQLPMVHQSYLCTFGAMLELLREVRWVLQNFRLTHLLKLN
jgi:hypothetical protein